MSDIKIKVRMRAGTSTVEWNGTVEDGGEWGRFRRSIEDHAKSHCPGNKDAEIRSVEIRFGPIKRKGGE